MELILQDPSLAADSVPFGIAAVMGFFLGFPPKPPLTLDRPAARDRQCRERGSMTMDDLGIDPTAAEVVRRKC